MLKKNPKILLLIILLLTFIPLNGCSLLKSNKEDSLKMSPLSSDAVLLDSAAIKNSTLSLINNASKSIYIQQVAIDDQEILDAIVSKAHSGLDIKILLDQWQRENQNTLMHLKNENISVQLYPSEKGQYERVKYMITDNRSAVYYGAPMTSAGLNSNSIAVILSGDTVLSITNSFSKDWEFTTTNKLLLDKNLSLPEDEITFVTNASIKQSLLNLIDDSKSTIYIEVDQLKDSDIISALIAAKKRGCSIQIIINPSSAPSGTDTVTNMRNAGIELRNYNNPSKPLGFNLGIFDQKNVLISSSGWTYSTFVMNHECSITIPSTTIAEKVFTLFTQDWNKATP